MTISLRQGWVALRFLVLMTLLLGVVYPTAVWAVGRIVPGRADGSFVTDSHGTVVGSSLIGQSFSDPQWFWPRPSAAGNGYDAQASSGSNLAADNPDLVSAIAKRQAALSAANGVPRSALPPDAVTASGSGLDPDISPAYAALQAPRVAKARGLSLQQVQDLIAAHTSSRILGFIGEPRVDVLTLNIALEHMT